MSHEWNGGNRKPGELEAILNTTPASESPASPISPIAPGKDTSEFQFTRGAQVVGGGLLAFMIVAQFIFERASSLPTSVMVTALIVAGLIVAWPTVQYTLNRRRLKSDHLAAQQAAHTEKLNAASVIQDREAAARGGVDRSGMRSAGDGTEAVPPAPPAPAAPPAPPPTR